MAVTFGRRLKKRDKKFKVRKTTKARTAVVTIARQMATAYLEKKFLDTKSTVTAFPVVWTRLNPTGGSTACLSMPAIGDTEISRDGRTFLMHSIFVRMTITFAATEGATAPINSPSYRVCLVLDQQTNNTAIVGTLVMDANAGRDEDSFRNLQNSKRFRVLGDTEHQIFHVFQLNEGASDLYANGTMQQTVRFNHVFKEPVKVRCTGTTADVASCSDNSLALIGIASTTTISYTYETRMRFIG